MLLFSQSEDTLNGYAQAHISVINSNFAPVLHYGTTVSNKRHYEIFAQYFVHQAEL